MLQLIKSLLVNRIFFRIGWIIWILTISVLSFLPGDKLPEIHWEFISIDTLVHFIMYFGLSSLMVLDFFSKKMNLSKLKMYLIIILVGISFGIFVELIQGFFIYQRYFGVTDILANSLGTIFGVILTVLTCRKLILINGAE